MATDREYLTFILDQLSGLEEVTYRGMMGEYILYYRGRIAAYLCDDRLLVKPVAAARALLPLAPMEPLASTTKRKILPVRFSRTLLRRSSFLITTAQPLEGLALW